MDLLKDVLSTVHFRGTVYCHGNFSAPWAIKWEGRPDRAGFFMVLRGGCYMHFMGQKASVSLAPGDFVMSPRALGYTLFDSPKSRVTKFDDVLSQAGISDDSTHRLIEFGGGGNPTQVIMGCFDLSLHDSNPFLKSLPECIYIKSEELQAEPWMETTLRFLAAECAGSKLGASITVGRLTELIFVQAIRVYLAQQATKGDFTGWLAAAAHPQIGQALCCIHAQPEIAWTVASLASEAHMSRSAFAAKFKDLTGMPPLDYVTSWRMHKAENLLTEDTMNLSDIAAAVGYASEAAFSKAFKRFVGLAPGSFRRARRGA